MTAVCEVLRRRPSYSSSGCSSPSAAPKPCVCHTISVFRFNPQAGGILCVCITLQQAVSTEGPTSELALLLRVAQPAGPRLPRDRYHQQRVVRVRPHPPLAAALRLACVPRRDIRLPAQTLAGQPLELEAVFNMCMYAS